MFIHSSYLHSMRYEQHRFVLEGLLNVFLEDLLRHFGVHCRQGIIQKVNVSVGEQGSSEIDALFLEEESTISFCATYALVLL